MKPPGRFAVWRGCMWGFVALMAVPLTADAQTDCTAVTLNKHCTVRIDRDMAVSPLPVRARADAKVTVSVTRRPLEQILFDVTLADTAPVDPLGAIVNALLTPIKSFVGAAKVTPTPPPDSPPGARGVEDALIGINTEQETIERALKVFDGEIKRLSRDLKQLQKLPAGTWALGALGVFRTQFSCQILGVPPPDASAIACAPGVPLVNRPLQTGQLDALDVAIKTALEQYVKLPAAERALLADRVNDVVTSQASLRAGATSLSAARSALVETAGMTNAIDMTTVSPRTDLVLGGFATGTNRIATIKITAQDLVSKATTTLATVTVHWGGTRWEVSAGAIFSHVPSFSYQNAPIIENGQPQLDAAGKVNTRITETVTRPTIVPVVLGHFRAAETAVGGQRLAGLFSFGIGVNPYSGSADVAIGGTFSVRGLMISVLAHGSREQRLTNGLEPNQELGSSPPALSTARVWVSSWGVGISYRIPLN